MSRRQALTLAGAGAVGVAVGAAGLARGWGTPNGSGSLAAGGPLTEPEVLASQNGRLHVPLAAAARRVQLAGRTVRALSYNGTVPAPTWRVRAGDRITVDLENRLDAPTNLHVHGLHVSPRGNSDNSFLHIEPGETFRYEFATPRSHPAGTYWYHPHRHGYVAEQVAGGLVGAILVVSDDEPLPVERERLLVVTDLTVDEDGAVASADHMDQMMGRQGRYVLVNGQFQPRVQVAAGGYERWRVVNACPSRFLRLRLPGAEVRLVGRDGRPTAEPAAVDVLRLATGNRADLLVRAPETGSYELVTEPVNRGTIGMGGMGGRRVGDDETATLLRVDAAGQASPAPDLPSRLADPPDLRDVDVDGDRTLTFGTGMGMGSGMTFTIDGRQFDPDRVDTAVRVGTVEEWTIANDSPMDHPFHLHVWPVQVIAAGGTPVPGEPRWQDVVNVPARDRVTVRVRFDDYPGRTVYHCHILDHEDLGMMAVAEAR